MNKKCFDDIVILRFIVILWLIIYHSTAFFVGACKVPFVYEFGEATYIYVWVARGAYAIMLEMFTFISGFLFASQIKDYTFFSLLKKKCRRLIIPAIVWGIVYAFALNKVVFESGWQFFGELLNGVGHLWFLPMLFWCFIIGFVLFKYINNFWIVVLCSFILCVLSRYISVSFGGFFMAFKYLFYFVLGFYICFYRNVIFSNFLKWRWIILLIFISLFSFISYYEVLKQWSSFGASFNAAIRFGISSVYKFCGVISLFLLVNKILSKNGRLKSFFYQFSILSMGIYVFHQMIIDYLYNYTELPSEINIMLLPAIAGVIALGGSALLTWTLVKMKVNKILL